MYKNFRNIYAGQNEIYRFGKDTIAMVQESLTPNKEGYYTIATDGGEYWTIGTSIGPYGEYSRIGDTLFSVNKGGYMYAKKGSSKEDLFLKSIQNMIDAMQDSEIKSEWLFPYRTIPETPSD